MRILKTRYFHQWPKIKKIEDFDLLKTAYEIDQGLFEAKLGNGLIKKRIARKGQGKSAGFRTIIVFKKNKRIIFVFGFAKNERENITKKEEHVYRKLAEYYLIIPEIKIDLLITNGELMEIYDEETKKI